MPVEQPEIQWIETPEGLERALATLGNPSLIYFDLEADNLHHYHSSTSLIQLYLPPHCFCFDMYAEANWQKLADFLSERTLVVHGADFDLRCLYDAFGFAPKQIFDTMLAARLCGETEFGLGALVTKFTGDVLDKKYQKADWSKRPLPKELVDYAARDTFYLPLIHESLTEKLKSLGRLEWHTEWCAQMAHSAIQPKRGPSPDDWRIKGSHLLQSRQLAFLQVLWQWREKTAEELNRAPFRVLHNQDLIALTEWAAGVDPTQPLSPEQVPYRLNRTWKHDILQIVEDAHRLPRESWPPRRRPSGPVPPPPDPQRLEQIKQARDTLAQKLELTESIFANKDVLTTVARFKKIDLETLQTHTHLMNWQIQLLLPLWENL